ncbi:MAG: ATP synthase F1 subunit gamma [Bacteroidales bacterium 45-6]|nr:MAG: ATP synthase F1 subunit gamma [Bacteroidales bacterium 45-6]
MASLKEIKVRIGSVKNTRKITSAMKMIASSKLHKAQYAIYNFLPYQRKLDAILTNLLSSDASNDSPFSKKRAVKRVGIVAFASNSTLCGAYNSNIKKEFLKVYKSKLHLGKENIEVYPVGKKIEQFVDKEFVAKGGSYQHIANLPVFDDVQRLSALLMEKYEKEELDEIILIYHHFKSTGTQLLTTSTFLPFDLTQNQAASGAKPVHADYILEPNKEEILKSLIPTVLNAKLFASSLDSAASEHAARMMAMQVATENADELIQTLTIQYNKTRQQAVTSELLDIIGGASAI